MNQSQKTHSNRAHPDSAEGPCRYLWVWLCLPRPPGIKFTNHFLGLLAKKLGHFINLKNYETV